VISANFRSLATAAASLGSDLAIVTGIRRNFPFFREVGQQQTER
jgi:hypothetical protein